MDPRWLVAAWAVAIALSDARWRRIPNALTLGVCAAALVVLAVNGRSLLGGEPWNVAGAAALAIALTVPGWLTGRLGAGDAKFLLAFACVSGLEAVLIAFAVGGLTAGALALGVLVRAPGFLYHPGVDRRRPLPFGTCLAAGMLAALVAGDL